MEPGSVRREFNGYADGGGDIPDISRGGPWKMPNPFSSDRRNWEDLTTELCIINKQIDRYNGKNILAIAILIISVCTFSIFYIVLGVIFAAAVVASNFDQKDQLEAQINSLGSRYRIYGGTFSFFGLFIKTISHNVDRYGYTM